jgi:predicted regulator of Ras-like GTPase activity (Roadblock/LC7/MglB family)
MPVISYSDSNNSSLKVAKCLIADCSFLTSTATVDSTGNVGQYTSITIGTDGLPVISYYDNANGDLKVAKCANAACSGTATITTVDTGGAAVVGEYSSITIGTDGLPVISYYDNSNGNLKVAKCPNAACGGAATISTVDSTGDVGQYTSITIGTDGLPVISYFDATNGDLKVAKCANQFCINNWSRR